jgi:hypothetical protein
MMVLVFMVVTRAMVAVGNKPQGVLLRAIMSVVGLALIIVPIAVRRYSRRR